MIIGAGVVIFLLVSWYIMHKKREREQMPFLIIFNPIDRTISVAGRYRGINRSIRIPVSDSEEKVFWAAETDHFVVLPAYGKFDDLIVEDERRAPTIKLMVAEIIGTTGRDPKDAIREWSKYAFDSSIYEIPPKLDLASVPPNYVFVRPTWKREWGPTIHRKGLAAVRNIFGEVARMRSNSDRELEMLHDNYGRMINSITESANEMILTMYYNALQMWDTISEQRVLPWEVMGRLLHQPMDQLNFTGLQQAIQGGNIREIGSQIIGSYRRALDSMAGEFGLTTMSQPMAEALMQSLNSMQHKLSNAVKREYAARQAGAQQLTERARQASRGQGSQGSQAPARRERPVINMYEE